MKRSLAILSGCVMIAAVLALAVSVEAQTVVDFEDLTLSIPDTMVNAAQRRHVGFVALGIDPDVVSATVTFTDSAVPRKTFPGI